MHGGDMNTSTPSVTTALPSGISTAKPSLLPTQDTSSVLTVRVSPTNNASQLPDHPLSSGPSDMSIEDSAQASKIMQIDPTRGSRMSVDSYHTASSAIMSPREAPDTDSAFLGSIAAATEGSTTTMRMALDGPPSFIHRFTLIKPGSVRKGSVSVSPGSNGRGTSPPPPENAPGWSPFDFFFGSGYGAKCDLCMKRLGWGWRPVLECDDCGMRSVARRLNKMANLTDPHAPIRAHPKCGESAPKDCGLRPPRHASPPLVAASPPTSPTSPRFKPNLRRRSGENTTASA
jgi:LIM domain kinase 1